MAAPQRQLFNSIAIDVGAADDARFLLRGWADAEDDRGVTFRWAVAAESTVAFALRGPVFILPGKRQRLPDYDLRVRVAPFAVDGLPPQEMTLDVNGRDLGRQMLEPGFRDYEFFVPHDVLHRNLNTLTFRHKYARSPLELGLGDDQRHLAVRFDSIRFSPIGDR